MIKFNAKTLYSLMIEVSGRMDIVIDEGYEKLPENSKEFYTRFADALNELIDEEEYI